MTAVGQVRGLDLPHLDCVVLLYVPLTSDAYVHLCGRTGRGALPGVALTVVPEGGARRLGLFSSQLGISVRPLKEGNDSQLQELEGLLMADDGLDSM